MSATRRWIATHVIELAFAVVLMASIAYWLRITSESWFFADEWPMALQVTSIGNIFEPYNGHLSVVILGLYRGLLEVFGLATYTPYRLAGALSLAAVSLAMFLHARRLVGPGVAAGMGLLLLWFPRLQIEPGGLNHSLALVGGIVCATGLSGRGHRRDLTVAGGLVLALASAGGGVAVAAAAVVHSLCTRASRWRWLAVLLPSFAWLLWWRLEVPAESGMIVDERPDTLRLVWRALGYAAESFASLALTNRAAGVVLLAAFVIHAIWRLRQGLDAAANVLAWSAALMLWWFGLVRTRWPFLEEPSFRYELLSAGFILLAVLPRRPAVWAGARVQDRRRRVGATVAILGLAVVLVTAVRPDLQQFASDQAWFGRIVRAQVATVASERAGVPDDTSYHLGLGYLDTGQVRSILRSVTSADVIARPDQLSLVAAGTRLRILPEATRPAGCHPLDASRAVAPEQGIELHTTLEASTVEVRRLDEQWVRIGRVPVGRSAALWLPSVGLETAWSVRAEGACFVAAGP